MSYKRKLMEFELFTNEWLEHLPEDKFEVWQSL